MLYVKDVQKACQFSRPSDRPIPSKLPYLHRATPLIYWYVDRNTYLWWVVILMMACANGIPMPIVKLNRWTLLLGIVGALLLQVPLATTALFAILLPATLFGPRGSLIYAVGARLFAARIPLAEREDATLQRFNNTIATTLLGLAQVAFLLGRPTLGWALAGAVAVAAGIAIAGFCVGCFLYYQFKLNRFRLLGR